MSIQIIENFDLTTTKPIDNRFVVGPTSFYVNKDDINYKYPGLRVWDLNDGIPYVWSGSTWSSENSSGTVLVQGGGATSGYISKFIGSSPTNIIVDSIIFDDGVNKIGIGTITPTERLEVAGNIKTTGVFNGDGSSVTNINASNITTGTLSIGRLQFGLSTQVLLGGVSSATWTNLSSVTIGNSTNAGITDNTSSSSNWNVTFVNGSSGFLPQNVSNSRFQYKPNTGQLLMYNANSASAPQYSFIGDTNTGIFSPAADQIAISLGGSTELTISSTMSTFNNLIRVNYLGDGLSVGYVSGSTNFRVSSANNATSIHLYGGSGLSDISSWSKYGTSYDEFYLSGRCYFNLYGSGTSDSRLLTFGSIGVINQIRFYMSGNSTTVPTVGGAGIYIEYNLRVNGDTSLSLDTYSSNANAILGGLTTGTLYKDSSGFVRVVY